MKESLPAMTFREIGIINSALFLIVAILGSSPWYFLLLTVAQLVFVPLTLRLIMKNDNGWIHKSYLYIGTLAFIAIVLLQMTNETTWDLFLAMIYFIFTLMVAGYGISRFLNRGFSHLEEFSIDMGLIYLAIGGAWFVAHESNMETGFSPIITWLTGIHFHYAAFLLPIFVGFLGRLYKPKLYKLVGSVILIAPFIVAVGITFSTWLELLSVIIYIFGIYSIILLSFKVPFQHYIQKWLIRISFSALGVTIIFSLLYALGNLTGLYSVSIDFMLRFHGIINSILFALIGIIGWSIHLPLSKMKRLVFPISRIRGKGVIGEKILTEKTDDRIASSYKGLVDNMNVFEPDINADTLSPTIIDFYENTNQYRLFAEIKWKSWFKPFAGIYRLISRNVLQINLPLSSQRVEMTGDIFSVNDEVDGRSGARAWVRKIKGEVAFIAFYASHQEQGRTYMNIALPLPWSSMIGILELNQCGEELRLTSKKQQTIDADSGIYLAINKYLLRLPLEEQFHVEEVEEGVLKARHSMWIFSIPFLKIDYSIHHQNLEFGRE